ncbi:MAG: tRNA uridine-5-carboxymethylaminomethyl(34) synthesis GTPase MnmE [Burkholderiales bacterium]
MMLNRSDPIAAIATAPGRGAVGIVRVSGSDLKALIASVCGRAVKPREATYLPFLDAAGQPIDKGLAIHFPAPHSYTGEDVLELQAHGGPIVLKLLLARCLQAGAETDLATGLARAPRLRIARPGEFTERAFLNDKIDLAQAEAVADLIDASTEAAARSAARSLSGEFSGEIKRLLEALTHLRVLVEATLDFPEEEIDFLRQADAQGQLDRLRATLQTVFERAQQGALLREGIKVVIAGQPNSGKSSLLNALAGAELAIVTPVAGTTRDKIAGTIQIEGVPIHVIDTAGLRESSDEVERIGIERAWSEIEAADAVLLVHDLTRIDAPEYIAENHRLTSAMARNVQKHIPVVTIWNKVDAATAPAEPGLALSAKSGIGIEELRQKLLSLAGWHSAPEGSFIARQRHVEALREVEDHLASADALLAEGGAQIDLLAEELRLAQNALSSITGEFSADDLLGKIFSEFCIGK